jgi:hypothetical protein
VSFATVSAPTAPAGVLAPVTTTDAGTVGTIGEAGVGEPYEGVLVTLSQVKVTAISTSGHRITLTDASGNVVMDDDIFAYTDPALNACLNVTGIMSVNLTDDERRFLPRQALDIVPTTGCP